MLRSRLALLSLPVLLALPACGGDDSGDQQAQTPPAETAPATPPPAEAASGACPRVAAPTPRTPPELKRPRARLDRSKTYRATFATSCGDYTVELDVRNSPKTSASVANLIRRGFYDETPIHRIVPDFVIQGGDPMGSGTGDPGYSVREAPPAGATYPRGTVAMAKTGQEPAGTSGSQFFVVTGDDATSALAGDYAIAGRVVAGQKVVDRIGAQPVEPPQDGAPTSPIVVRKVTLRES